MFNAVRADHCFHAPSCRKQFHKNEGAFGKVNELVEKHMKEFQKRIERLEIAQYGEILKP